MNEWPHLCIGRNYPSYFHMVNVSSAEGKWREKRVICHALGNVVSHDEKPLTSWNCNCFSPFLPQLKQINTERPASSIRPAAADAHFNNKIFIRRVVCSWASAASCNDFVASSRLTTSRFCCTWFDLVFHLVLGLSGRPFPPFSTDPASDLVRLISLFQPLVFWNSFWLRLELKLNFSVVSRRLFSTRFNGDGDESNAFNLSPGWITFTWFTWSLDDTHLHNQIQSLEFPCWIWMLKKRSNWQKKNPKDWAGSESIIRVASRSNKGNWFHL